MSNLLAGFLSVILFLDCIVLIFLVLLQLPKKEAGAGMAFGGAATDALFGAGSGNALTTITKYSAGVFFGAALILGILYTRHGPTGGSALEEALAKPGAASGLVAPAVAPITSSNSGLNLGPIQAIPAPANSTAPAASTNSAAPPATPPAAPLLAPPVAPPVATPAPPAPAPGPATNR
jgi:protein translocase SecG subunit